MPIPIIASDMTITSTSIVSHVGMRFADCVIACALAAHVMYRLAASGCERVHIACRARSEGRRCATEWSEAMKDNDGISEREYQDRLERLLKDALNTQLRPLMSL